VRAALRVSVIVPFLNEERFLGEAIESVLAQTYRDWELVLVDDGSSDRSADIAREYVASDADRIALLRHADGGTHGLSASRNLGIAHARGGYIAFLDADDVWLPRKLEEQTAILDSQPEAGMVYGLSQWWYSWTGKEADSERDFTHELGVRAGALFHPPSLISPFFVRQTAAIPSPTSILIRRDLVERVGGFDEVNAYEDQAFYAKVILEAPVSARGECWDRYRQHDDSITARVQSRGQAESARAAFLDWLIRYLSTRGFGEAEFAAALRRQRFLYVNPWLTRAARRVGRGA
jgi:glycosyltransferase involved in cell wall biosynthesis